MFKIKNGEYVITGVKKIASMSKDCQGHYGNYHLQLMYDPCTGKAWVNEHTDRNSETIYDEDRGFINCGIISEPVMMYRVRNMITWKCTEVRNRHNKEIIERIEQGENLPLSELW